MAVYNYVAYDNLGKEIKGVAEGENERKVRQELREKGLTPIRLNQTAQRTNEKNKNSSWTTLFTRVSSANLALMTREFATLLSSGTPVEESLLAVSQQIEKPYLKQVLLSVRARVMEGYSLAAGLDDFPKVFPEVYRATVAAGEQTGYLDKVLMHLADYTEKQSEMKQKIQQALIYPSLMTLVSISIVIFLLSTVVPKMIAVFHDTGTQLPAMTEVLISLSHFIKSYGLIVLAVLVIGIILFQQGLRRLSFRTKWHGVIDNIPLIGKLKRSINAARFSRTLGILTAAGMPILDGIAIATKLIGMLPMRDAVQRAAVAIREGAPIHRALQKTQYFQPMIIHFIANGEKSGRLEEMLQRAADNQERHVSMVLTTSLSLFEPILILVMGGVVLFIVLAVLVPMFQMTQMVK